MQSAGDRVYFIRKTLLDVPRTAFMKFNVPETTFRNWEKSKTLSKNKCNKISKLFLEFNINVSSQWLYDGTGPSPVSCMNVSASSKVKLDIETFKFNNQAAFIISANNNNMSPLINEGDFIGGIEGLISWKEEFLYIIKTQTDILVGFVQRLTQKQISIRYTTSTKIKILDFSSVLAAYRIIFIRKVA